jgi:hypothetical protein
MLESDMRFTVNGKSTTSTAALKKNIEAACSRYYESRTNTKVKHVHLHVYREGVAYPVSADKWASALCEIWIIR